MVAIVEIVAFVGIELRSIQAYIRRMLVCVRTSMNLPDSLLAAAKSKAAAEGSTVTQLVVEGLRARISAPAASATTTISLPSRNLGRALADMSDNAAVREILDAEDDEKYRDHR
jgi:hypothetical protein